MASKNAQIATEGADALFVPFAFFEVDSPGPEDGAFHSSPPETTCNHDGLGKRRSKADCCGRSRD